MILRPTVLASLVALLVLHPSDAHAASIWPFVSGTGSYRAIVIEGEITAGDAETFLRIVREHGGRINGVYLYSPGGDFFEALRIGRAIRALELTVSVPSRTNSGNPDCEWPFDGLPKPRDQRNCTAASAAFFIYLAGVHRSGLFLAAHRPTFVGTRLGTLSQSEASRAVAAMMDSARTYMSEMGTPLHIQDRVLSTQPAQAWIVEESVIRQFLMGPIPSRAEWLKARCEKLQPQQRDRLERFRQMVVGRQTVPSADTADYARLRRLDDEERGCQVEAGREARVEAFERVFGEAAGDDTRSHLFSRWPEAVRYLGKAFHELTAEERFEESSMGSLSFLERPATANAPLILLSDSRVRPRVVSSISLLSTPNPSSQFIARTVEELESSWGPAHSANAALKRWTWDHSSFTATLILDTPAVDGRHLVLKIERREQ